MVNTTRVINIRAAPPDWEEDPQYVYIGRAGRGHDGYFGNPFSAGTRRENVALFGNHFSARIVDDEEYRHRVSALMGKTLVCFCEPLSCHGDWYRAYLDAVERGRRHAAREAART